MFDDRVPTEDAEVARRLAAAGAVVIGKANLHEFAFGGTSATSYYGPVRNPWALERNPGGSSGGSAAAVATDLCYGARHRHRWLDPHAGVVLQRRRAEADVWPGLDPRDHSARLSLDHCGPLTRTVMDAAMMLNVLAGYDRLDIASVEHPTEDYVAALTKPVSGFTLGYPRAPFFDLLDADVGKVVDERNRTCSEANAWDDRRMPSTRGTSPSAGSHAPTTKSPSAGCSGRYMIPTRRALKDGANLKAADYIRGSWRLELLRRTIDDAFAGIDLVVLPTRRRTPRTVDASIKREETDVPRNPELENTGAFNVFGIPAISVPCGFTSKGLPVGSDDRWPAILGGQGARPRARVRAGHRLPHEKTTDPSRNAGTAAGND